MNNFREFLIDLLSTQRPEQRSIIANKINTASDVFVKLAYKAAQRNMSTDVILTLLS